MNFKEVANSVKGFVSKMSWQIEKHKPEILLVTGIVSTVAGVVLACRATVKAQAVVEEHKNQLEVIEKSENTGVTVNADGETVEYTHDDAKKDRIANLARTGLRCGKLYLLSALLIGLSIFCQIKGYKTLSERLAMASAAYAALATKFKNYRKRVADKLGSDEEAVIYHDMKAVDVVRNGEDENGNPIESKETVFVADDDDYTALFTQYDKDGVLNPNWYPDSEQNLDWLRMEQDYWNKVLKCRKGKPVFLNEVRERLRVGRTQKAQAVGWVYKPDDPNHVGDNYIDFGLDRLIRAYRNGDEMPDEASFVLDFNVDGNVLYAV
ncbi:MAG: hypothetical protein J6U54_10120 [Clostridiales bacterium]|nr:hypothetical protein [Clostridiales bacterium]